MEHRGFWPDVADQRICAEFMTRFPSEGPGMCYLFGALRGQGFTRAQAARLVRDQAPQGGTGCDDAVC